MGVFRDLMFRLKYGNDSDIEELMKNREEIKAEIKSLLKEKREIELRIEKVLAAREETRKRVEKQMEMEKKRKKQRAEKTGEKTGILRGIGRKQDQRSGKVIPEEEDKKLEIRKKAERKKEEIFPREGPEGAKTAIDSEVEEVAELMAETIEEAELEAGLKPGGKTETVPVEREEMGKEVKTELKTEVGTEGGDKKTPSGKPDKHAALFSNQIAPENEDDSEGTAMDGKEKDEKTSAGFFGGNLLEELLNDDSLNMEEEKNILKFIEDTSTEELIRELRYVREQLFATST